MAKRRLRGWYRLWIILTVLYGIAIGAIAYDRAPTRDEIINAWANAVYCWMRNDVWRLTKEDLDPDAFRDHYEGKGLLEGKNREDVLGELTEDARRINIDDPEQKKHAQYKQEMLDSEIKYKAKLAKLPQDQFSHYLSDFMYWWLIPNLVLLFFGHAIAWVIRGFRRE